jgi:hypothetical protein
MYATRSESQFSLALLATISKHTHLTNRSVLAMIPRNDLNDNTSDTETGLLELFSYVLKALVALRSSRNLWLNGDASILFLSQHMPLQLRERTSVAVAAFPEDVCLRYIFSSIVQL